MPWEERTKVSERLIFISRLEEGESMSDLCREFGISRKTGYKFLRRYQDDGPKGLEDLDRRPYSNPRRLNELVVNELLELKKRKPNWGSAKIRELFRRKHPDLPLPARSTVHLLLDRYGLVDKRSKRRRIFMKASPTELNPSQSPNDLWTIDFKGQFSLIDGSLCYPLTVADHFSRYLIGCEALLSTKAVPAIRVLESIFQQYGLPNRIRSDNGSPFASTGVMGLTTLSVWLLRLGITLERIEPGKPQQNGRHERMHRTLKRETTRPPEPNILRQQERFEIFRREFNFERPHESLNMETPGAIYQKSKRRYVVPSDLEYPGFDKKARVHDCGNIVLDGKRCYVSRALRGERIGLNETDDDLWEASFMEYKLGFIEKGASSMVPIS